MNAPPRVKCHSCDGKAWFPHPDFGAIACQVCDGSGLGGCDVPRLIDEWGQLKAQVEEMRDILEKIMPECGYYIQHAHLITRIEKVINAKAPKQAKGR